MKSWGRALLVLAGLASGVASAQTIQQWDIVRRYIYPDSVPLASAAFGRAARLRSNVEGWALTGSRTEAYEVRCDDVLTSCEVPILRTKASADEPFGLGSITHSESAVPWRGRRVAVRAEVRAGRIGGWGGVWMRIDGQGDRVLAFDNMQNRPLRGTSAYEWVSVVLDVPEEAEKLSFGVLLHGPGALFIRELRFELVDGATPSTDLMAPLRASTAGPNRSGTF